MHDIIKNYDGITIAYQTTIITDSGNLQGKCTFVKTIENVRQHLWNYRGRR